MRKKGLTSCQCLIYKVSAMGPRIIALLKDRGWSRAELARRIGVSRMAVSAWCKGQDPSVAMLRRLAAALAVTESYLLHGDADAPQAANG